MPATTVHPLTDQLEQLRQTVRTLADEARDLGDPAGGPTGSRASLDVERFTRLAEYALAWAASHGQSGQESDLPGFGFVYTALNVLTPPDADATDYPYDPDMAMNAVRAISDLAPDSER
jgi:hypothetical protein